ncbi:alpha/beta fold hydrolase [Ferruginibacter sp. SUN002]|uniref:alpha/beta fold hydrolase n=1 Tax=Ferruginibacter sp. SUN002 TaxID=2937789 RepID=UPI003D36602F
MQNKQITYNNTPVFYQTIGKGNPILLLHGFGEDGTIWKNQIDFLQNDFYLIIPDIPGSGKSSYIDNADIEIYAEIVKLIIDEELVKSFIMIGHSMGGYITLSFAEKYPQYLKAFGLFHSSAFADNEEKKLARKKSIEFIIANGAYSFIKTSIPGLFKESSNLNIQDLIEKGKNFTPEALIQYYDAMINRPDRTAVLKSFPGQILFIIGEFDNAVPLKSSLEQCYLPYRSDVHILKESGHMAMLEEPIRANDILFNFLRSID